MNLSRVITRSGDEELAEKKVPTGDLKIKNSFFFFFRPAQKMRAA